MSKIIKSCILGMGIFSVVACSNVKVDNTAGQPTVYVPSDSTGPAAGVGIESQDIVAMTDKMMRDMLANPTLANRSVPPRIVIDSSNFVNESSSIVNKKLITNRLRTSLNRAANGRMVFVGRHAAAMVEKEREMKRSGVVDAGTIRHTAATAGVDYKLAGEIVSQDRIDPATQMKVRFNQINFEMFDMELGTIVWSGIYEFSKASQDNVMYR